MRYSCLAVVILLAMVAAAYGEMTAAQMQDIFDKKRAEYWASYDDAYSALSEQYVAELDGAVRSLMLQGDPVPVAMAKHIRDAAAISGEVPESAQKGAPELIQKFQQHYGLEVRKLDLARRQKVGTLLTQHIAALERKVAELTAAGDIDGAIEVKAILDKKDTLLGRAEDRFGRHGKQARVAEKKVEGDVESDVAAGTIGGFVREIPLMGAKSGSQWRKQLFTIPAGSRVKVTATPKETLSKEKGEPRCFAVKLGSAGEQKWFGTGGNHTVRLNKKAGRKSGEGHRRHAAAQFFAEKEDSLYILQTQNAMFTLTVEVTPASEASEKEIRKWKNQDED